MNNKHTHPFMFKIIYPLFRYFLLSGRWLYSFWTKITTHFSRRPESSPALPDTYEACNTSTVDSEFDLVCLEGVLPVDIFGQLFIAQCLGTPEAFMVGDTNIVRLDIKGSKASLTNQLLWTPAAVARMELRETPYRFDFFGLMYLSPGLGMFSYTEGMYLLPDGRIAVTSDIDRPWTISRDSLRPATPIGRRDEWMPMMSGNTGEILGKLFAGYSNSHVMYTDFEQEEVFMVNYQLRQADGQHPVRLIRWNGYNDFESWLVVNEKGEDIEIIQSIHELVFTRDFILLADTAFVAGSEMFTPWVSAPLPYKNTIVYIIDRRMLTLDKTTVTARRVELEEPCIHLISQYENPDNMITVYMLQTPATNTAEILRRSDRNLNGELFPEHIIGYGTLPVLDLSSVGKHVIDASHSTIKESDFIREKPYCWGPYLYAYQGRQIKPYTGQDLFVMFKGFSKDLLPKRIYNAHKNLEERRIPLDELLGNNGAQYNNSICRITTKDFHIADAYVFDDRVLLFTIAHLDSTEQDHPGYIIAGIVTDEAAGNFSNGNEYWIFEANHLAKGPVCKLGHPNLNNTTLFHTLYIPEKDKGIFDSKTVSYHVPLREDYAESELNSWGPDVKKIFNDFIWPLYDQRGKATKVSDEIAFELNTHRKNITEK